MNKMFFLLFSALLLLFACKSAKKSGTDAASMLIGLETTACFGFCPVFTLEVQRDGFARYEGRRFVEKMGRDSFRLSAEELKTLTAKVLETNLWQYPDHVKTDVADAPFATLSTFDPKRNATKQVKGSIDRPKPLIKLEEWLKDLAGKHGCEVRRGVDPKAIPQKSRKEVIVQLQNEVNAGNWIHQYYDLRIKLERRLGAANLWLVAYDSAQISETDLMAMFRSSDGVLSVTPNEKVNDRN